MKFWFGKPAVGSRPVDADLLFMGKALKTLSAPLPERSRMAEIRANTLFGIIVFMACYFGWCLYDRFGSRYPVDVRDVEVMNEDVKAGDKLYIRFKLFRHRICEYDSEYTFIDSANKRSKFVMPHSNANGLPGADEAVRGFDLPSDMSLGPAKLRLTTSWACPENIYEAVYPIAHVLPDIHFNVIP